VSKLLQGNCCGSVGRPHFTGFHPSKPKSGSEAASERKAPHRKGAGEEKEGC